MGAFVGAMFAMGMDGDEIDARCYDEWVRRRPLGDYTLPRHALIRGERAEAMLERTFGDVAIEELAMQLLRACRPTCAAAELVVSRDGDAVRGRRRAASAFPVLAPPQVRGRRCSSTARLVDNLPVGAMAALGEGPIIAVDVKPSVERSRPSSNAGEGARSGCRRSARR